MNNLSDTFTHHTVVKADHQTVFHVLVRGISLAVVFFVAEDTDNLYVGRSGFLVGGQTEISFVMGRNFKKRTWFRIRDNGNGRKDFLYLFLHILDVEVSYDSNGFQVRAVPFVVKVAQGFGLERPDDIHVTDDIALGIFRAFVEYRSFLVIDTGCAVVARTPLLGDDPTFLVDVFRVEGQVIRPVVQNKQARVRQAFVCHRHIADVINRFVLCGVGIQVPTERDSMTFECGNHAVAREVLTAVKGHVFQKVGQAVLIVILKQCACVADDEETGPVFRFFVMPEVIGDTVR